MKVLYGYITKQRRENIETLFNRLCLAYYLLAIHATVDYRRARKTLACLSSRQSRIRNKRNCKRQEKDRQLIHDNNKW